MSERKTLEQRTAEVVQRYLDWSNQRKWTREEEEYVLGNMVSDAIARAQKATAALVHYGSERTRPPREFPSFPFADHRTIAQVDQAKEPA